MLGKDSSVGIFQFQPQLIGDHGNKFRVGRLPSAVVDGVAKIGVKGIHIAPIPSHLNGMTMARSTREEVVSNLTATDGYNCLVTELMMSGFSTANMIDSLR